MRVARWFPIVLMTIHERVVPRRSLFRNRRVFPPKHPPLRHDDGVTPRARNCPAVVMMRKISDMPTNGDVWSIETVAGFTMATTAAVSNRLGVVQVICCKMVNRDMTEEQMRPEFERVLQGQDLYGNTVMHSSFFENIYDTKAIARGTSVCFPGKARGHRVLL